MIVLDRKLTDEEIIKISKLISNSFIGDPFIKRYYNKHKDFENLVYIVTKFCNKYGEVHFFEDYTGAALWIPPGVEFLNMENLRTILLKDALYYALHSSLKTTINIYRSVAKIQEGHLKEPHYYLFAMGIEEKERGKGLGTALMKFAFNKFGNQNFFLENSNKRNIEFYSTLGFSIIGEADINGAKVTYMEKRKREKNGTVL